MRSSDLDKKIDDGIHQAVANALIAHKKAGRSIVIWQDGKVVEVPPEAIQIPQQRDHT